MDLLLASLSVIDERLARACPRPTNPGAWLFLAGGLGTLVVIGASLATPMGTTSSFYMQCWSPAAPNPLSGGLCATLAVFGILLPVWAILPPTRRAVEQPESAVSWDRPAWPTAVRVSGTMLLLLLLGSATSALQDASIGWSPETAQDCTIAPPAIRRQLEGRRDLLLLWAGGTALGLLSLALWASTSIRSTGTIRLDERGLELDGERWSFKDIVRAEVKAGQLCIERYDGGRYEVKLFRGEFGFARALVEVAHAHLPSQTEDRDAARNALAELARDP